MPTVASPRSVAFQYWETTSNPWPGNWLHHLTNLKSNGTDEVCCLIPWGLHESVQGIRDFSKGSRLRLEKFLSLAHQVGLTVRATVGFPPCKESFPTWSLALGEQMAMVPAGVWRSGGENLSMVRLPSIHDEQFYTPFLEFVSDVASLLSLYRFPEGPVVGLSLDWGVYENDLGATALPSYAAFLQQRYPQASLIGMRYHCTFRDYAAAASAQGTRVLFDKRPWLAAFDYKSCRAKMLQDRTEGILALRTMEPLLDLFCFGEAEKERVPESDWAVVFDPTLLEGTVQRAFPFAPLGLVNAQAIGVFRLWEYLDRSAKDSKVPLLGLTADQLSPAPTVSVIAGRFLPSALARTVRAWVEEGTSAFFPFGIPQYDENLIGLSWRSPGKSSGKSSGPSTPGRLPEMLLGQKFTRMGLGKGQIRFSENPSAPEPRFWELLRGFSRHYSEGEVSA